MPQVQQSRTYTASPKAVWDLLADYPNISEWNSGIKHSASTSDATSGVGAMRHCDLKPFGSLEETVLDWQEGKNLKISIDSTKGLPIKSGVADFVISEDGAGSRVDFTYDYEMKFGPIGKLLAPMMKGQLDKGFKGFLDDLGAAATA